MKALLLGILLGMLVAVFYRRRRAVGRTPAGAVDTEDVADRGGERELERLTRPELYRRAQAAGIAGRSEMTKAQLIAALRAHARDA